MQGLGNPVSAAGQCGKAGTRLSSSCDRSSTCVDNLAHLEYDATSSDSYLGSEVHRCSKLNDAFCYICCKYEVSQLRAHITDGIKNQYEECFGLQILHQDKTWVPHIICNACKIMLNRFTKEKNRNSVKYSVPAKWIEPNSEEDCYFCKNNKVGGFSS